MIVRIVKMQFHEEKVADFLKVFEANALQIRNFPGCQHLQLLADAHHTNTYFTYSWWDGLEDLENYRHSTLFEGVWAQTKVLFSGKPEAWSVTEKFKFL
jgi:heme-degrading monooxygenase HmoA